MRTWRLAHRTIAAALVIAAPAVAKPRVKVSAGSAVRTIEAMRRDASAGTFGGKLRSQSDASAKLAAHYARTWATARSAAADPGLRPSVRTALEQVSLPATERWRLDVLAGEAVPPEPEKRLHSGLPVDLPGVTLVDPEPEVENVTGKDPWSDSRIGDLERQNRTFSCDPPLFAGGRLRSLRHYARAKFLGIGTGSPDPYALLASVTWPETEEAARVLRRFAKAYGMNEAQIQLGRNPGGILYVPSRGLEVEPGRHADPEERDRLLAERAPGLFELDRESLKAVIAESSKNGMAPLIDEVLGRAGPSPSPLLLRDGLKAWQRVLKDESELAVSLSSFVEKHLDAAQLASAPEVLRELIKLQRLAGIDPDAIQVMSSAGSRVPIRTVTDYDRLSSEMTAESLRGTVLSGKALPMSAPPPERPSVPAEVTEAEIRQLSRSPSEGVAALEALAQTDLGAVVTNAVRGAARGQLRRIDFNRLSPQDRERVVAALTAEGHLGVATVLAGLFLDGGLAPLSRVLRARGNSSQDVREWLGYSQALHRLGPEGLRLALRELEPGEAGDFLLFPLRLELARSKAEVRPDPLHYVVDGVGALRALLERADLPTVSEGEREEIRGVVRSFVADGTLSAALLRDVLGGKRYGAFAPEARAELVAAVDRVDRSPPERRPAEIDSLLETLRRLGQTFNPAELVDDALTALYEADLRHAAPLGAVSEGLRRAVANESALGHPATDREIVAGIELEHSQKPGRDPDLIPRLRELGIVETDAWNKNVKPAAIGLAENKLVVLIGETGNGKSLIPEYLAAVTKREYYPFNCSKRTRLEDFIGRMVIPGVKYTLKDLNALSDEQLRAIGRQLPKVDLDLDRDALVKRVYEAQSEPVWVDGPLTTAFRRGGIFTADEIDTVPRTVLKSLNSAFDHRRTLYLPTGEVVHANPDLRLFATMNGRRYSGRELLSRDAKSRWSKVIRTVPYEAKDFQKILITQFGDRLPEPVRNQLVKAHMALAEAARQGAIGGSLGELAYSARDLTDAARRFVRYRPRNPPELTDSMLLRREIQEVYLDGLWDPEEIETAQRQLRIHGIADPPPGGFYRDLKLTFDDLTFTVGDVTLQRLNTGDRRVPSKESLLELTQRDLEVLQALMKAHDMGESSFLLGDHGNGKTAAVEAFAHLRGQPLFASIADPEKLIGSHTLDGFRDGDLPSAGRPDGIPGVVVVDEVLGAKSSEIERLNSIRDRRMIVLHENGGERIRLHRDMVLVATSNPPGRGYAWARPASPALYNRWRLKWVRAHTPAELRQIAHGRAEKWGVPLPVADALVDLQLWIADEIANDRLGKGLDENELVDLSTRKLVDTLEGLSTRLRSVPEAERPLRYGQFFKDSVLSSYAAEFPPDESAAILAKADALAR